MPKPSASRTIVNAKLLVPSARGKALTAAAVLIEDGRIKAIGPRARASSGSRGARRGSTRRASPSCRA